MVLKRKLSRPKKKSIMQDTKECWLCGNPIVEEHHIFFGNPQRKISDENGFTVYLCHEHHQGNVSPHHNRQFDLDLKQECQRLYEEKYGTRADFMKLIGRSYL